MTTGGGGGTTTSPKIGGYSVYFGNLHAHTSVSDGEGSLDDAFTRARDKAGLDFFGVSEHDYYPEKMSSNDWSKVWDAADSYNDDGTFVAFPGFEWTSDSDDVQWGGLNQGHLTIVGTPEFCSSGDDCRTLDQLVKWLDKQKRGVAILNHPGAYEATFDYFNFRRSDRVVGMELWNADTDFYSERGYRDDDGFYDEALKKGWHIGAGGGQDTHDKKWGTTSNSRHAVLAETKTRKDIFGAIEKRRFYSTRDSNLALSFECNGRQMGDFVPPTTARTMLSCTIEAYDGSREHFRRVYLIKNGRTLYKWKEDDFDDDRHPLVTYDFEDDDLEDGDYLYVRVDQRDEDSWAAISSPIFVTNDAKPFPVTPMPTEVPTTPPPTTRPTATPLTEFPTTSLPTERPTSAAPSVTPTVGPTDRPSEVPSDVPTLVPTTVRPTDRPSASPITAIPTTIAPTTTRPTAGPTMIRLSGEAEASISAAKQAAPSDFSRGSHHLSTSTSCPPPLLLLALASIVMMKNML